MKCSIVLCIVPKELKMNSNWSILKGRPSVMIFSFLFNSESFNSFSISTILFDGVLEEANIFFKKFTVSCSFNSLKLMSAPPTLTVERVVIITLWW